MRQQVVGFCELYMLVMGSWSVMGGSTLLHVLYTEGMKCSLCTQNLQGDEDLHPLQLVDMIAKNSNL